MHVLSPHSYSTCRCLFNSNSNFRQVCYKCSTSRPAASRTTAYGTVSYIFCAKGWEQKHTVVYVLVYFLFLCTENCRHNRCVREWGIGVKRGEFVNRSRYEWRRQEQLACKHGKGNTHTSFSLSRSSDQDPSLMELADAAIQGSKRGKRSSTSAEYSRQCSSTVNLQLYTMSFIIIGRTLSFATGCEVGIGYKLVGDNNDKNIKLRFQSTSDKIRPLLSILCCEEPCEHWPHQICHQMFLLRWTQEDTS